MFSKTILILSSMVSFVYANQEREVEEFLRDLSFIMEENKDPDFDVLHDDVVSEIRRISEDHGFNTDDVLLDISFLKSLPGIFKSGDARRWTTVNFAYQLACYGGKTGPLLLQALWAYRRFNGYACYCGAGYYFGNYLDATDLCCKGHDSCYERVMKKYNLKYGCDTYTVPYSVSCCKKEKYTKCTDSGPSAGRELCECDQNMARCTAKNAKTYNADLMKNRSKCKNVSGVNRKPMTAWETLKSCKHAFHPNVKFPLTYGSQGSCPNGGSRGSWLWR
ncbi:uncharacterized protein LOC120337332 [Styela clava]